MSNLSRPHLFGVLAGLFLAAGLVLSSTLATTAWLKVKNSQFVTVKGSARKNITADLVIWRASFNVEAVTLLEAQSALKAHHDKVSQFIQTRDFTNVVFAPIGIEEVKATLKDPEGLIQQRTVGYRLTQSVRVESGAAAHIAQLDAESAKLVEAGVMLTTMQPEFIYTKAGEAKIEMLAEAAKDARVRANQIATHGGRHLAGLHDAGMGIFQITPLYSSQTSGEGMNDTSSLEKTITAVVTATFGLK